MDGTDVDCVGDGEEKYVVDGDDGSEQVIEQVVDEYCHEDSIKLEFEEEVIDFNEERDFHAQALMTLHQSVQNLPKKHKTGLQEAVREASPIKRPRREETGFIHLSSGSSPNHPNISTMETPHLSHLRFDPNNPRTTPTTNNYLPGIASFTPGHTRTMKGLYNKIANILKLTSARRWVYHEWFYSNIDRSLILGQTDFESCLQQLFTNLKTRMLTKAQWTTIRRLMGKPRRCSPAFFAEERIALEEKRKKIRYLHQLKGFEVKDMTQFKDLPEEIPMPMVLGTKVTAKVHPEGDGLNLFTGTVDAIDNINNTYRINFDRVGIGTHSIPDVEVASEDYEAMNLQLFVVKERPKIARPNSPTETYAAAQRNQRNDIMRTSPSRIKLAEALNDDLSGTFGGFPIRFLLYMTRLSKIIALKKKYVDKLKELNGQAELLKPLKQVKKDFQKTYAFVILELEKINTELHSIFQGIHDFVHNVAPQLGFFDQTAATKIQCDEAAALLVEQSNRVVNSAKMRELVTRLTSLMLLITRFSEGSHGAFELSSIDDAVQDIKASLDETNRKMFEDRIETGIAFIKNGLQDGCTMLDAFANHATTSEGGRGSQTGMQRSNISTSNSIGEEGQGDGLVNGLLNIDDDDEEEMMDEMDDDDDDEEEEEEEDDLEELGEEGEEMDTVGGKFELLV